MNEACWGSLGRGQGGTVWVQYRGCERSLWALLVLISLTSRLKSAVHFPLSASTTKSNFGRIPVMWLIPPCVGEQVKAVRVQHPPCFPSSKHTPTQLAGCQALGRLAASHTAPSTGRVGDRHSMAVPIKALVFRATAHPAMSTDSSHTTTATGDSMKGAGTAIYVFYPLISVSWAILYCISANFESYSVYSFTFTQTAHSGSLKYFLYLCFSRMAWQTGS